MTLSKKELNISVKEGSIKIFVNPYKDAKNEKMRGFVNISIIDAEGKTTSFYNSLSVIEHEGKVFLSEPRQKAYKDAEGKFQSTAYFLVNKHIKDIVVAEIIN